MKINSPFLIVAILLILTAGCSDSNFKTISQEKAVLMMEENHHNADFMVLDLRTPAEYAEGHIEGAVNLDFKNECFTGSLETMDRDKTYLIHCRTVNKAGKTLDIMKELGFKEVYLMDGGFKAWKENDRPIFGQETEMKRVTGVGGVFFKAENPEGLKDWYHDHLGIESDLYGHLFKWREHDNPDQIGSTTWAPFTDKTEYFKPSEKQFMINYRVENLEKLMDLLREEGVEIVGEIESYPYGKFGWIMDPEGNKIELWEPVDENL
ncbi:MAG: hypothetical protein K9G67_14005 [Bacteroidales bacterium]|nr:hypothetical protein [Bacteroidales bacterium]MCF8351982.1 hypothetical protein [Bacteroidales bacterium]MCF8377466.1 hypothetical protein [Bacteroidales bacterium]MCF8401589.1 hypothetical protein [Bacteroidales bacterium]